MPGQQPPTMYSVDNSEETPLTPEEEAEVRRIVDSFDARLTEAEQQIDRVLARLGIPRVA